MTPARSPVTRRVPARFAFTLLEVLLTLSMSVVLMVLLGGILQFYGRDMQLSDEQVRQVQLASAIMQMIEDDLRAAMHTKPVDTEPLGELLASVGGGGGGGTASDAVADPDAAMGLPEDDSQVDNIALAAAVLQKPGLIGNQNQIQVDVSRLPRLEEYLVLLDGTNADLRDIPSDIKTVAYFVQAAGAVDGVQDAWDADGAGNVPIGGGSGLVRRSLDRAATMHASLTGGMSRLSQTGDMLAPEIVGIEFAYWDGFTWQLQWSTDVFGELPQAVRVTLTMLAPGQGAGPGGEPATRVFAHVVRLPLARPLQMEQLTGAVGGAL